MGRQFRDWVTALFAISFAGFAALTWYSNGAVDWRMTTLMATMLTAIMAVRFYFLLKPEMDRLAEEEKEERVRQFNASCSEIALEMSRLSDVDLSVFVTAHKYAGQGGGEFEFMTGKGSPIHKIMVAMCDVRCTRPIEMKQVAAGSQIATVRYEITELGRTLLPHFLRDAAMFRHQERSVG